MDEVPIWAVRVVRTCLRNWAESVHSLQVRGLRVSMATTDIQAATDQGFVLRCGRQLSPRAQWPYLWFAANGGYWNSNYM